MYGEDDVMFTMGEFKISGAHRAQQTPGKVNPN